MADIDPSILAEFGGDEAKARRYLALVESKKAKAEPKAEAPKKAPAPRAAMERAARPVVKAAEGAPTATLPPGPKMGERHRIEAADLTEDEARALGDANAEEVAPVLDALADVEGMAPTLANAWENTKRWNRDRLAKVNADEAARQEQIGAKYAVDRSMEAFEKGRAAYARQSPIDRSLARAAMRREALGDTGIVTYPEARARANDREAVLEKEGVVTPPSPGFTVTEAGGVGEVPKREPSPAQSARRALVKAGMPVDEARGLLDNEAIEAAKEL